MRDRKTLLAILASAALFSLVVYAQDNPAGPGAGKEDGGVTEVGDVDLENKLLKLTTLEEAFLKALRSRNLLQRYIAQENAKLKEAVDDEAKKELRQNIGAARKRLQTLAVAMDVVFGIGNRREYEYDSVKSTVHLRVGTVEEVFARAVRSRELLRAYIGEQQAALENETDEAKKKDIEKKISDATRRYQIIVASLQMIYGVVPQRNYQYDPRNATLYLKVSESELEKLRQQIQTMQEERDAAGGAAAE